MTTITIDGQTLVAGPGQTVLETARAAGIAVPTLCYHHALGPYGTCRLCIVEAEGPKLQHTVTTSCNLLPADGLIVETATPRIQALRTTILELMLSGTKMTPEIRCRTAGAAITGKSGPSRISTKISTRISRIYTDPCILCGLCIRVCRETIRANALNFSVTGTNRHRVAEAVVMTKERCIGCGTCAAVCPVGAIRLEDRGTQRRIILYGKTANSLALVRCDLCSRPFTTEQFILSVLSRVDAALRADIGHICPDCGRSRFATALTGQFPPDQEQAVLK